MTAGQCDEVRDLLVDHADGALSPADSARLAEHAAECPDCRALVGAVERGLAAARLIWADGLAQTEPGAAPRRAGFVRRHRLRVVLVAAVVLLAVLGPVLYRAIQRGGRPARPPVQEVALADVLREIDDAGVAARMLAGADLIARQPGGEKFAADRYQFIVSAYPRTEAAAIARRRLLIGPVGGNPNEG